MDRRVAIDLAGGGLEDPGAQALGQAEHVDGAVHAGLGGLHRVVLVVDGAGRAGQVVDLVHLDKQRKGDVVAHQLEAGVVEQVRDVVLGAGEEVVDTEHVVPFGQQAVAQVAAQKAGAAGDEDALGGVVVALGHDACELRPMPAY
jgi:hypothetical protein